MLMPLRELEKLNCADFSPPIPDFKALEQYGVRINPQPIQIKLADIHIDDAHGNSAREHGTNPASVERMKNSLSKGWMTHEFLPAVRKLANSNGYQWELVYGYTRTEAMEMLYGSNFSMWFNEIYCDESNIRKVRSTENEGLIKTPNKESDLKHTILQEIKDGYLKNDSKAIMTWLNDVCPTRDDASKNRILLMVEESAGTQTDFQTWTSVKADRWVKNHSSIPYVFGGGVVNGVHTFMCRSGYQYRTFQRMIKHYLKDGLPCQVVLHVDSPTKNSTLEKRRQQTLKEWYEGINNLKAIGADVSFMSVAGFLPQEKGVDNWSKLVDVQLKKKSALPLPTITNEDFEKLEETLGL